jgi:hypothetical protein
LRKIGQFDREFGGEVWGDGRVEDLLGNGQVAIRVGFAEDEG